MTITKSGALIVIFGSGGSPVGQPIIECPPDCPIISIPPMGGEDEDSARPEAVMEEFQEFRPVAGVEVGEQRAYPDQIEGIPLESDSRRVLVGMERDRSEGRGTIIHTVA